jgi:hypothetical protein
LGDFALYVDDVDGDDDGDGDGVVDSPSEGFKRLSAEDEKKLEDKLRKFVAENPVDLTK